MNPDGPGEHATELRLAEAIGAVMEFWGFKRAMGRVWTVLYLSPAAVTAAELGERLGMSAGAVSMTVAELLGWGAIRKLRRAGDRRDFYEAETQIGKLITRVIRERELRLVREVVAALEGAVADRATDRAGASRFARERLSLLLTLARLGEGFLGQLVAGAKVDPNPIRTFTAGLSAIQREA